MQSGSLTQHICTYSKGTYDLSPDVLDCLCLPASLALQACFIIRTYPVATKQIRGLSNVGVLQFHADAVQSLSDSLDALKDALYI